ncbi:MAG: carboxypeptidase-like regulatory domain-containing protein, partial [Bacteroidales bacterium]|nr:carboxypeptidase-like regulatory domain-containing protein [Bacteroidales bacterium]
MYKTVHILLCTMLLVVSATTAWAQSARVTLSGTVADASNGETMMGVYVILSDLSDASNVQGCITNQAGYYSVSVLPGKYKLTVNYLGYKTIDDTLVLNKNLSLRFELEPAVIEGEEVVIQGERGDANVASGDVGRMEMSIQTIKALPALMGEADIIKSIQLLPGVQSGGEGNSGFYVRGSGTDQNLI